MLEFCITNNLMIGNSFWFQRIDKKYIVVVEERGVGSIIDNNIQECNTSIKEEEEENIERRQSWERNTV